MLTCFILCFLCVPTVFCVCRWGAPWSAQRLAPTPSARAPAAQPAFSPHAPATRAPPAPTTASPPPARGRCRCTCWSRSRAPSAQTGAHSVLPGRGAALLGVLLGGRRARGRAHPGAAPRRLLAALPLVPPPIPTRHPLPPHPPPQVGARPRRRRVLRERGRRQGAVSTHCCYDAANACMKAQWRAAPCSTRARPM